jgi:hypothetical protein
MRQLSKIDIPIIDVHQKDTAKRFGFETTIRRSLILIIGTVFLISALVLIALLTGGLAYLLPKTVTYQPLLDAILIGVTVIIGGALVYQMMELNDISATEKKLSEHAESLFNWIYETHPKTIRDSMRIGNGQFSKVEIKKGDVASTVFFPTGGKFSFREQWGVSIGGAGKFPDIAEFIRSGRGKMDFGIGGLEDSAMGFPAIKVDDEVIYNPQQVIEVIAREGCVMSLQNPDRNYAGGYRPDRASKKDIKYTARYIIIMWALANKVDFADDHALGKI